MSVACKDYVEVYGIHTDAHYLGASSLDSVEPLKVVLAYITRSLRDLLLVRSRAIEVLDRIAEAEPALAGRSEDVRALLCAGSAYLKNAIVAVERGAKLMDEVLSSSSDFKTREATAAALAHAAEDEITAHILNTVSRLHHSEA